MSSADLSRAAREAQDSPVVEWGARVGFAVLGLLHLLVGYLALNIAWGLGGSGRADQSGALTTLASSATGTALLSVGVAGFALLAVWNVAEAALRHGRTRERARLVAKGVLYAFFAYTTFAVVALGRSQDSESQTDDVTRRLMGSPAGQVVVAVLGLVVVGVAVYHVHKGWTTAFLQDLREHPGAWAVHAGRAGYVAKGVALLVVGFFFLVAAWQSDPQEAKGLDGALTSLEAMTAGPLVLTLVAVGIAAYGVYSLARARYARL